MNTTTTAAPSVREIAELTARLRALSAAGAGADPAERTGFLADKRELLDRIAADQTPPPTAAGAVGGHVTPFGPCHRDGNDTIPSVVVTMAFPMNHQDLETVFWLLLRDGLAVADLHNDRDAHQLVLATMLGFDAGRCPCEGYGSAPRCRSPPAAPPATPPPLGRRTPSTSRPTAARTEFEVATVADLGEQAQQVGLPILYNHTYTSTLWIIARDISNEVAIWPHADVLLVDRAVPDALGYYLAALAYRNEPPDPVAVEYLRTLPAQHGTQYDLMFRTTLDHTVPIGSTKPRDDNNRYRQLADHHVGQILADLNIPHELLYADGHGPDTAPPSISPWSSRYSGSTTPTAKHSAKPPTDLARP